MDANATRVLHALLDIAEETPPSDADLAATAQSQFKGKYDGLLPDNFLCKSFGASEREVQRAMTTAHLWAGKYSPNGAPSSGLHVPHCSPVDPCQDP